MNVKEKRKNDIINSAIGIFMEKGYHDTKIEEIAKEVGIGKGTVYEYFSNKKELFEEVCIQFINDVLNEFDRIIDKEEGFKNKIIGIYRFKYKSITVQRSMAESFFVHGSLISDRIKDEIVYIHISMYEKVHDIIKDGIEEGVIKKDVDIDMMSACLMGTSNQYIGFRHFCHNEEEKDINFEKILNSILEGFGT